jgi:hypothetical protein
VSSQPRSWLVTAALAIAPGAVAQRVLGLGSSPRPLLVAVLVLLVSVGHARFDHTVGDPPVLSAAVLGEHEIVGVMQDEPRVRGQFNRVDLNLELIDGLQAAGAVRVTLRAPLDPLEVGERLQMTIELEEPPEIEAFDYPAYLASRDDAPGDGVGAERGAANRDWDLGADARGSQATRGADTAAVAAAVRGAGGGGRTHRWYGRL